VWYERIAFPLARDGEHVDMLIVVFVVDLDDRTPAPATAPARGG
jgi:hypothetical protein